MSSALPSSPDVTREAATPESSRGRGVPLSFSQQQLWYVCQYQGGTVAYNQPVAWRLSGAIDLDALERSFRAVLQRHEALRTTFPVVNGEPQQRIHDDLPFPLRVVDLRGIPEATRSSRAGEVVQEEARYPFNLAQELLLRAVLIQVADQEFVFVITVHHIMCDGWSMGILIEELSHFYRAFSSGHEAPLRDLPIQYPEFATMQREQMRGENHERQLRYWKDRLRDCHMQELPTDKPRPAVRSFSGASLPLALPKEVTAAFKNLSAREEVFFFMGLLAAFQVLLHRYTGQNDIVVGAPVAARKRAKLQRSIGLYLNLIALRCDLSTDPTFRQLLRQVRDVVMGAYQHQDLPFEQVVEAVRPARDPSRNPVFQVMLDQVDQRWIALDLQGTRAEWFSVDNGTSKYDLTLAWSESPQGLRGWLEYNTDLFHADTIQRMLGHYQEILISAVANPDQHISEINLLTAAELKQITETWNASGADYPEACIHELFTLQAKKTPDAVAVTSEEAHLTYDELDRKSNQFASWLAKRGVGRGSVAGVCLPRNCDLLVALLGVLKTGAAYLPLDPAYPRSRTVFMIADSGLNVLVTLHEWANQFADASVPVVCLDRDWPEISGEPGGGLFTKASPDDPAYVIYTSGSTGQPKGVVGLHRGAVNRFTWMYREYSFEPGEVACAKTSLSFVDSVWETFGPMLAGIPTVLISEGTAKDPHALTTTLARHEVSRIVLVPSLLRAMLDAEPNLGQRLPRVKYWTSSGEALRADLLTRFRAGVPHGILLNLYGSSEASADVTCYDTRQWQAGEPVLAGRPISNTQIYILDANLRPVPAGVSGQLCVAGDGLAQGYLRRPDQTAQKFVANPFRPGSRLYLTGDLARYRSDGNIELLGRMDHQVKVRGFRVELGEVETMLAAQPSIKEAVVTARNDDNGDTSLVAYVVALENGDRPPGAGLTAAECANATDARTGNPWSDCANHSIDARALPAKLRQFLRERLPGPMIPSDFVLLRELPQTPSGKVDRAALPAPVRSLREFAGDFAEPQTGAERMIRQVWCEVLQLERVGTSDNFFDVGGHSLLLAAVHTRLMRVFRQEIPSTDLYRYPTIRALAARLSGMESVEGEKAPLEDARLRAQRQRESRVRRTATIESRGKPEILQMP